MKLKSLIEHLQDKLDEHEVNSVKPDAYSPNQRETYFNNLEADYTFRIYRSIVGQFKKEDGEKEISADHIKILTDSLKNRWSRIKSSDASYSIEATSSVNYFCRQLASYLVTQHQSFIGHTSANKLLMPTVKRWRNPGSDATDLSNAWPHRFVLDDKNEHVYELGHLYEDLRSSKLVLSYKIRSGSKETQLLSDAEQRRVMNHSQLVKDYYEKVKPLLKYRDDKNEKKITALKFSLRDELLDNGYVKNSNTIKEAYGSAGQDLLKKNLLEDVDNLFADREQLLDYMSGKLMRTEWKEFLNRFSKDGLRKVFCGGSTVEATVISDDMKKGVLMHDLAADYCKVRVYWDDRKPKGKFATTKGRFFGGAKDDDIELAVIEYENGLTVDRDAIKDWKKYVESKDPKIAELMRGERWSIRYYINKSIETTVEKNAKPENDATSHKVKV
ncbi:MAG TPA: hypothetical protein VL360_03195 [Gammaproteobacteria bacterium]|jgi:hypothetical protein|nr:hypothetical protein [Gammaproteobacteria bacterium]